MSTLTPHLRLNPADISPLILTCGDTARAKQISEYLTNVKQVGAWREYHSFTGEYKGLRVSAVSHGVGGAGAAICFEELIRLGARTIIRVGTCGSYLPEIRSGDLLIGTGATREDGTSNILVDVAYPAISDLDITNALREAAQARGDVRFALGVMRSDAAFYHGLTPNPHNYWAEAGAVGIEMELATLLIIASLRRIRAGGIFVADGNPNEEVTDNMSGYDPHRNVVEEAKGKMIEIALEALRKL
ncbi:MAG: purine-nucleoside phosphorylase [Chloroflexota bacterium]|nr:MAG: purine-nucleoside phosphorylase [Chloroflexota bacterium]